MTREAVVVASSRTALTKSFRSSFNMTRPDRAGRCSQDVFKLVHEGARILEEGFAPRAVDFDIAYLYGCEFAEARGWPMCYADMVGLNAVYDRSGDLWASASLIEKLAEEGKTVARYDKERGR